MIIIIKTTYNKNKTAYTTLHLLNGYIFLKLILFKRIIYIDAFFFMYLQIVIITKVYCHNKTVYIKNLTKWFLIGWPVSSVTLNQSPLEEDWYSSRVELWSVRKLNSRSPYTQPGNFRKESSVTNVTDEELRLSSVKSDQSSITI